MGVTCPHTTDGTGMDTDFSPYFSPRSSRQLPGGNARPPPSPPSGNGRHLSPVGSAASSMSGGRRRAWLWVHRRPAPTVPASGDPRCSHLVHLPRPASGPWPIAPATGPAPRDPNTKCPSEDSAHRVTVYSLMYPWTPSHWGHGLHARSSLAEPRRGRATPERAPVAVEF